MIELTVAIVVAALLTPAMIAAAHRFGAIDVPNVRSSHAAPTPRGGGVAVVAAILIATAIGGKGAADGALITALAGTLAVAVIGLADDLRSLPVSLRLGIHMVVALAIAASGTVARNLAAPFSESPAVWWLGLAVTVFWIVGMTNAFNFMDGINGIASVQAAVAAATLSLLLSRHGDPTASAIALAVAGAAAGFLPWNFPHAKIFMGDVGSSALGFLLAFLAVRLAVAGGSLLEGALPLLPFVFDTAYTLARRVANRERWWEAHRTHLYQKMVQQGFSHAAVTATWGALAVAAAAVALTIGLLSRGAAALVVGSAIAIHAGVAWWILSGARRAESQGPP